MIRIAVLDTANVVIGYIGGRTSQIYDDKLQIYLKGSASTLTFSIPIEASGSNLLKEGNRLSFEYEGRQYFHVIRVVDQTRSAVTVTAYGLPFELLNDEVAPASYSSKSFAQIFASMGIDTDLIKIGNNERQNLLKNVNFESTETILSRLYGLADAFDAELDFRADLTRDFRLKAIYIDVLERLGQDRQNILKYGRDYSSIERTADISDLFTAIRPEGAGGLTLSGFSKPADDYELVGTELRNPKSWAAYPSVHVGASGSGYITRYYSCDATTQSQLYSLAGEELKKGSKPKITYKIEGLPIGTVGDTYQLYDDAFTPAAQAKVRLTELQLCLSDPDQSTATYTCEEVL